MLRCPKLRTGQLRKSPLLLFLLLLLLLLHFKWQTDRKDNILSFKKQNTHNNVCASLNVPELGACLLSGYKHELAR